MTYLFKLSGETPSKKNSRVTNTKTGRTFPNKRYTQWHAQAKAELFPQIKQNFIDKPIDTPLTVHLIFIHGDKRRRDSDNGTSSIFDLLKDSGIIADDNYNIIRAHYVENYYKEKAAACYIKLETIKEVGDNSYLINMIDSFIK